MSKQRHKKKSKASAKPDIPDIQANKDHKDQPLIIRHPLLLISTVITMMVIITYIPVYQAGFIWDDDDYILLNPLLENWSGLKEIWNPGSALNPQYYPMVFTMFFFERNIFGIEDATGYHITNVFLHAANAVLLLLLLRRIGVPGAWVIAALFAVHPVYVESVAWITERKNVLSGLFYLGAAHTYLKYDETSRLRWYITVLVLFLLALLSKTVTASLPIALGLILWWRNRSITRRHLFTLSVMLVIGFIMGMITRSHEYKHVLMGSGELGLLTFIDRILIAGRAIWFYPLKIIWPVHLSFMYDPWIISPRAAWQWLFPLGGFLVVFAMFVLYYRKLTGRGALAATLFYAVTIFPALGFVNVAPMRFSFVADHFQYLASIGIHVLIVGGIIRILESRQKASRDSLYIRTAAIPAVALLVILAGMSYRQAKVYHDQDSLWSDTVKKSPDNWLAQINYGVQLKRRGQFIPAAACFQRAIQLKPPPSEAAIRAYMHLSAIRFHERKYEESLHMAESCLKLNPYLPIALSNKARSLYMLGRLKEAETTLIHLVNLKSDPEAGRAAWDIQRRGVYAQYYQLLAEIQAELGNLDEAIRNYENCINAAPSDPNLHNERIQALLRWNKNSEAVKALYKSVSLFPETGQFTIQLAWILANAPNPGDRNGKEAYRLASGLVRKTGGTNPLILSILASAQAELGQFDNAATTARQALDLAKSSNDAKLTSHVQSQVQAYSQGKSIFR